MKDSTGETSGGSRCMSASDVCEAGGSETGEVTAAEKYSAAVALYASTDLSLQRIADACGVTPGGLGSYIGRHHRNLLLARYGLFVPGDADMQIKVRPRRGQSRQTHLKYKEAIEACGDMAFIENNVSEIARMFGLNPSGLANQLRVHYPDVIPMREKLRSRMGIADNRQRGRRKQSVDSYGEASELYRDSGLTIPEVARQCEVSEGGLSQYMRFYQQDVIAAKAERRLAASRNREGRKAGMRSGNGRPYGPGSETEELYAKALTLYRETCMSIEEIAAATGVSESGFRFYLTSWHPEEKRQCRKAAEQKYSAAIASLRERPRAVMAVASEFGLNADVFREYLKLHEPALAEATGMMRTEEGRVMKRSSYEKYKAAVEEYAASRAPLKEIALRHGLVYTSLYSFVKRNCLQEKGEGLACGRRSVQGKRGNQAAINMQP